MTEFPQTEMFKLINAVSFKVRGVDFFNPRIAHVCLDVSVITGSMQVKIARTLNPNHTGRIEKGTKVYDNDNSAEFSISATECASIYRSIPLLLKGTYINPDSKIDPKYKNAITITHFRNNKPSRFLLERSKDKNGNLTGSLRVSLFPPEGEGVPASYMFRPEEMVIFNNFVKHCAIDLPYHTCVVNGVIKLIKSGYFDMINKPNDGGYKSYGEKRQDPEVSTFDVPSETSPEEEHGSEDDSGFDDSMSDADFGF